MFNGRTLCIATMHGKEKAIGPILEKELGIRWINCKGIDTDLFGTFSGEVERKCSSIETAKQKCLAAIRISGIDLAVSSEGSFGAHPTIGFLPANQETLYFLDYYNHFEIYATEISTNTNFAAEEFEDFDSLERFSQKCLFPSHGLIIKDSGNKIIEKGVTDLSTLKKAFYKAITRGAFAKVETDMRALYNPTRMKVIEECAKKLAIKISNKCPTCDWPGYSFDKVVPGLPCEYCKMPTKSSLMHIATCNSCGHRTEKKYPNKKQFESQMYCDFCNP